MIDDKAPPGGHTNENGYFVWGNPAAIVENARQQEIGQAREAREKAQRAEQRDAAANAARAVWEHAAPKIETPPPLPEIIAGRERDR